MSSPNFDVSYAVLNEDFHTPRLGTMKKSLVLNGLGNNPITRMYKWDDLFVVETQKGQVVMPIEHVRYMEASKPLKQD